MFFFVCQIIEDQQDVMLVSPTPKYQAFWRILRTVFNGCFLSRSLATVC
jgi:hypothetical protein